jgi:hypothetical protein
VRKVAALLRLVIAAYFVYQASAFFDVCQNLTATAEAVIFKPSAHWLFTHF